MVFLIKRQKKKNKSSNIRIVRFCVNGTPDIDYMHGYMVLNGNLFLLFYVPI